MLAYCNEIVRSFIDKNITGKNLLDLPQGLAIGEIREWLTRIVNSGSSILTLPALVASAAIIAIAANQADNAKMLP
jgi:hypothetical protein